MSEYTTIDLDISRAGVAVVLLNRPQSTNAFNAHVVDELSDVFSLLSKSPEVRVVIIRGAGDVFSSGDDLTWLKAADDFSEREFEEDAEALGEMLRRFHALTQPTLVLVNGEVRGPAMGLVAASDVAISGASASFGFNDVLHGRSPAVISPFVVETIGARWAKALLLTGETFDGNFAYHIGLVQFVAKDEAEMGVLEESIVTSLFDAAPSAVSSAKAVINDVGGMEIDASLTRMTAHRAARQRISEEGREGAAAILAGRAPKWRD